MGSAPPGNFFSARRRGGEESGRKWEFRRKKLPFQNFFPSLLHGNVQKRGQIVPRDRGSFSGFPGQVRLLTEGGLSAVAAAPGGEIALKRETERNISAK